MLVFLAASCTLILDEEITDKLGSGEVGETGCAPGSFWADADGDGFGNVAYATEACDLPSGYADNADDCDDVNVAVNPSADETCDGIDNDCEGTIDQSAVDAPIWYQDLDLDSFGNDAVSVAACTAPDGYVATDDDCDDGEASISPAGLETCDDTDQDCDGADSVCGTGADSTTDWGSEMIAISAGSFTRGGGAGDWADWYVDHVVTLTHDFWIGRTEITLRQWESFSSNAGWTYSSIANGFPCTTSTTSADCPADTISWYDVAKYANALSAQEGLTTCYLADGTDLAAACLTDPYACPGYRMPTEAEWEYAARAGQDTEFSGSNTAASVAWYQDNAYSTGKYAPAVATLAPNAWGLYDMSGNVWEWTNDWYSTSYSGYGSGVAQTDPAGPTSGSDRVVRGGSWYIHTSEVRVAVRNLDSPSGAGSHMGTPRLRASRQNRPLSTSTPRA